MSDNFTKAFQDQLAAASSAFTKFEVPAPFRDFAEKSVQTARGNYEKLKSAAEQTSDAFEGTYSSATKGVAEYNVKSLELLRSNINSTFDYLASVLGAGSAAEAVELSTSHLRQQYESIQAQTKELSFLVQKIATESAEPLKATVDKAFVNRQ